MYRRAAIVGPFLALSLLSPADISAQQAESKIQHVVVIFQENRTPDNLFQDPVLISTDRRDYSEIQLPRPQTACQ